MKSFSAFRNCHAGASIIVCGCGESLNALRQARPDCITIGVNDVGRLFDPDYLVVLNKKNQFSRGRYAYVENTRAKAVFSHYRLVLKYSSTVQFNLGRYAGTEFGDPFSLPYTRNSPYVAVCLAAYMGATKIGLLGVDFTDHHFFGKTGRHPLAGTLEKIDREYHDLKVSLQEKGIRFVNLSSTSRLTCLGKISIDDFLAKDDARGRQTIIRCERESTMKVQIEMHGSGLIGDFMNAMAKTAGELGYTVTRDAHRARDQQSDVKIVWNGRYCRNRKNVIYCEHGWLPREAYQVSHQGINADSHMAPFVWEGTMLSTSQRDEVADYLESLRCQNSFSHEYMRTDAPAAAGLPAEFILVPLQMENDTNIIHHVDPKLRRMQWVIDYISQSDPPYPVIYKQHPADARKGNGQLRLRVRRRMDQIRAHGLGNIHQILKSGACKGIVSLNSNVVHDGFLWDVPAVVLGNNIWPRSGISPFMHRLPDNWSELEKFYSDRSVAACREAYIHFIMNRQWTMEDASIPDRVDALLQRKLKELKPSNVISLGTAGRFGRVVSKTTINVVAKNRGWLFEDLKTHFVSLRVPGVRIIASENPIRQADAWIYPRADEAGNSPDLSRTLVQIHDQFQNGYQPEGRRRHIESCGAVCFTHPDQEKLIKLAGIDLEVKRILIKPLGVSRHFQLRQNMPRRFTVAWVGRPVKYQDREFKRLAWFIEALEKLNFRDNITAMLLGDRLGDCAKQISRLGITCDHYPRQKYPYSSYPGVYRNMDCLVITSEFAAGPNCLFEALAVGVPVIATPCGWVETLIRHGENGFLVKSPSEIATAVDRVRNDRHEWFNRRERIRRSIEGFSLERWLEENIRMAVSLVENVDTPRAIWSR